MFGKFRISHANVTSPEKVIKLAGLTGFFTILAVLAYAAGGIVCHQLPDRSFYWGAVKFPVCARCTGLYLSASVGLLAWAVLKLSRSGRTVPVVPRIAVWALLIAAIPTAVSLASAWLGVWEGTNAWRAAMAVPLGASAGAMVAAVATKDLR